MRTAENGWERLGGARLAEKDWEWLGNGWEWLGNGWEWLGGAPNETAGLRDYETTRLRDHKTARPRDHRKTQVFSGVLSRSQSFSVVPSCAR